MDVRVDHRDRTETVRGLLASPLLDFGTAMAFLNTLPATIQASTAEAAQHARTAVAAAPGGDHRHEAVARYTLARVLVALEAEQAIPVSSPASVT